jgi:hypothetical protein
VSGGHADTAHWKTNPLTFTCAVEAVLPSEPVMRTNDCDGEADELALELELGGSDATDAAARCEGDELHETRQAVG